MSQGRHQMRLPQPAPQGFQNQSVLRYTLSASGLSLESSKVAVAQRLSLIRSPDAPSLCEKSGLVPPPLPTPPPPPPQPPPPPLAASLLARPSPPTGGRVDTAPLCSAHTRACYFRSSMRISSAS